MENHQEILDTCAKKGRDLLVSLGFPPTVRAMDCFGPCLDFVPLVPSERKWIAIELEEFVKSDAPDVGYFSRLHGIRSDGQHCQVAIYIFDRYLNNGEQELRDEAERKIQCALVTLHGLRDCSCGVIGYDRPDMFDEAGKPLPKAVLSPCKQHNDL